MYCSWWDDSTVDGGIQYVHCIVCDGIRDIIRKDPGYSPYCLCTLRYGGVIHFHCTVYGGIIDIHRTVYGGIIDIHCNVYGGIILFTLMSVVEL